MEEILSKKIADEFMSFKGKIRGVALNNYAEFIIKEDGLEGLEKIEREVAKVGYPIKYRELKSMDFYPLGFQVITVAAMKKVLNYDDEKFYKLGGFQPKISFIIKLFVKYFVSIDRLADQVSNMWRKYYTVGELKVVELNKEKKYIFLRLEDFPCHPLHCHQILRGYFASTLKMVVRADVTCQETKCPFSGDEYHEFLIRW